MKKGLKKIFFVFFQINKKGNALIKITDLFLANVTTKDFKLSSVIVVLGTPAFNNFWRRY